MGSGGSTAPISFDRRNSMMEPRSSMEFSSGLLKKEKVAVVPGPAFGSCGEGFVRCCYATSMTLIEEAMARTARFVARLRG